MNELSLGSEAVKVAPVTFCLPNLTFPEKTVIAVFGKTDARVDLFLRMIAGNLPHEILVPPAPGRVRSHRMVPDYLSAPVRLNGDSVFEGESIFRRIGVLNGDSDQNILGRTVLEEYLSALSATEAGVPEVQVATPRLRAFGLSEILYRSTAVLSGGEKQRLACAVATVGTRRLLVADFSSTSLDLAFRAEFAGTVRLFASDGGIAVIGGVELDEFADFGVTRSLVLTCSAPGHRGEIMVEESKPSLERFPPSAQQRTKLEERLQARTIGDDVILSAEQARRKGLSQPLTATLRKGEILVVTGPNGVGKSTFGRLLVEASRARAWYRLDARLRLGWQLGGRIELSSDVYPVMAPQDATHTLLGSVVEEELPEGELRKLCGLTWQGAEKADPRELPQGTQKLISVANALRLARGLVILDEPSIGMDMEQKLQLVDLLNQFGDVSVVLITHDVALLPLGRQISMEVGS